MDVAMGYAAEFLESWLGFQARQADFPGFAVAVRSGDQEIFSQAYGMADVAMGIPLTAGHLFGVGSQSKMVTATAILQLAARGSARLDGHVVQYLPWLARHHDTTFQELTIRHLLSHSTGLIRDGENSDYWLGKRPFPDDKQLCEEILATSLRLESNVQMKYSNLGFALLGQVVEAAGKQQFGAYVRAHIMRPLGLDHTKPDWTWRLRARAATGYTMPFERARLVVEPNAPMRALAPAAGFWATPSDMCRFAAAHFLGNIELISDEMKREAQHSQWTITKGYDRGYEYGLGFEVMEVAGRRLFGHGGSMLGYRTATFFDPRAKLAVSVAVNCKDAPTLAMTRGIFGALFHFIDTAAKPAPKRLAKLNTHLRSPLSDMRIVSTKGAIVAIDPNLWDPFPWAEQLAYEDAQTLRVMTPSSIHAEGEKVSYNFKRQGIASVNYTGLTLKPLTVGFQVAKPKSLVNKDTIILPEQNSSFTLPGEAADVMFAHYLRGSGRRLFMLEVLPEYGMHSDDSYDSLHAWLSGKTRKSIALLEKVRSKEEERPPWRKLWPDELRLRHSFIRVRLIDEDFTPYMQWEREHYLRINLPLVAERIYTFKKLKLGLHAACNKCISVPMNRLSFSS